MNPNLNRDKAYLRKDNMMFKPIPEGFKGTRELDRQFVSISGAKVYSRELMKQGHTIVTK